MYAIKWQHDQVNCLLAKQSNPKRYKQKLLFMWKDRKHKILLYPCIIQIMQ